jgi:hypothetical protein
MSGGDLLFIVSFIILPTVILVSCVWLLVLIHKGVVLPPRRYVRREAEPDAEAQLADDRAALPTGTSELYDQAARPASEQTLELEAWQALAQPQVVETEPTPEPPERAVREEVDGVAMPAPAEPVIEEELPRAPSAPEPPEELEVLFVPTDTSEPANGEATAPAADERRHADQPRPEDEPDEPTAVAAEPVADVAKETGVAAVSAAAAPRKPARRVVPFRPFDEPVSRQRMRAAGQRRGGRRRGDSFEIR